MCERGRPGTKASIYCTCSLCVVLCCVCLASTTPAYVCIHSLIRLCVGIHVTYIHSLCMFVGHSDVLMGVLCLNDEELEKRLRFVQFGNSLTIQLDIHF